MSNTRSVLRFMIVIRHLNLWSFFGHENFLDIYEEITTTIFLRWQPKVSHSNTNGYHLITILELLVLLQFLITV